MDQVQGELIAKVRSELAAQGRSERWLSREMNKAHTSLWRRLQAGGNDFSLMEILVMAEVLRVPVLELLPTRFRNALTCVHCNQSLTTR